MFNVARNPVHNSPRLIAYRQRLRGSIAARGAAASCNLHRTVTGSQEFAAMIRTKRAGRQAHGGLGTIPRTWRGLVPRSAGPSGRGRAGAAAGPAAAQRAAGHPDPRLPLLPRAGSGRPQPADVRAAPGAAGAQVRQLAGAPGLSRAGAGGRAVPGLRLAGGARGPGRALGRAVRPRLRLGGARRDRAGAPAGDDRPPVAGARWT